MRLSETRRLLHRQFAPRARGEAGLSPLNKAVVVLILCGAVVTVAESEPDLPDIVRTGLSIAQTAIGAAFLLEYAARLWAAGEEPRFAGLLGRLRYAATWPALVDLAALSPLFLSAVGVVGGEAYLLRLLRLARVVRIARLGGVSDAMERLATALAARRYEFAVAFAAGGCLMLFAAALLHLVEGRAQPEAFGSIPRALWWSVATLTTVGYGDVTPVTPLGRALAGVSAVLGVGVIAMPAGIIASALGEAIGGRRERGDE